MFYYFKLYVKPKPHEQIETEGIVVTEKCDNLFLL